MRRVFCCLIGFLVFALPLFAQDREADLKIAFARAQHLKRGINVSHWFSQNASDYSAQHTDTETTPDDIALIAKLGFDNVRLSIDATPLEQYPRGADGLNDEFMMRLDRALDSILDHGMAVQVDLHPEEPYKQGIRASNSSVDRLVQLWRKLAAHYANRDPERVFFEIMNEPEEGDPYRWAGIQARVAAAIREVAPHHTIIATGPNYSDIVDLLDAASPPRRRRDLQLPLLRPARVHAPGRELGRAVLELRAWHPLSTDGKLDGGAGEANSRSCRPLQA